MSLKRYKGSSFADFSISVPTCHSLELPCQKTANCFGNYKLFLEHADGARACDEVFQLTLGVDASIINLDRQRSLPRKDSVAAKENQLEVVLHSLEGPDLPEGYILPPQTAATLTYC